MAELRKYGVQATFSFPLIDAGAIDFEATPVVHAAGDSQVMKNEAAFANTTNAFAHEGNGIYSLVLDATEMEAARIVVTVIDQGTKAWEDQAVIIETYGDLSAMHPYDLSSTALLRASQTILEGSVDTGAGFTPTTSAFESDDITEATADHYNGRRIIWVSGALLNQATTITDYELVGSNGKFTVDAMTEAPANNDKFIIL